MTMSDLLEQADQILIQDALELLEHLALPFPN